MRDSNGEQLDPTQFSEDLERVLAQLHNLTVESDRRWYAAAEISSALRDRYGVRIHWRTIDALLGRSPECVDRRKRGRRWEYILLAEGEARIRSAGQQILLVDPENSFQAVVRLHDLLSSLKGTIRICDPYADSVTIEHLEACPKGQPIQLLTCNIRDSGKLRRLLAAAVTSGYQLELRLAAGKDLHDRYIIDDAGMVILGTSLNGFGKKQCFVIQAGQDMRAVMLKEFVARWGSATPWP